MDIKSQALRCIFEFGHVFSLALVTSGGNYLHGILVGKEYKSLYIANNWNIRFSFCYLLKFVWISP